MESRMVTAKAASSSVQLESRHTEQHGQSTTSDDATYNHWSDSIVEKFHERIVTDSSGHVLLHEEEHSKDIFKGSGQSHTRRTGTNQMMTGVQGHEQSLIQSDSIYNGGSLMEVSVVGKRSGCWQWWLIGLLCILLLISGIKR